jgi:hypothetical protein
MRRLKLQERIHARCACSITWIIWISKQELSPSCGGRNTCLYAFPNRAVSKRKRHPAWRLPPIAQLFLRCLNSGIHAPRRVLAKRSRHPCGPTVPDLPPRRDPISAAGHRGPHSVRSCAAAAQISCHTSHAFLSFQRAIQAKAFDGFTVHFRPYAAGHHCLLSGRLVTTPELTGHL